MVTSDVHLVGTAVGSSICHRWHKASRSWGTIHEILPFTDGRAITSRLHTASYNGYYTLRDAAFMIIGPASVNTCVALPYLTP